MATTFTTRFDQPLAATWRTQAVGAGRLQDNGSTLRLLNGPTRQGKYNNAQIDDYQGLARSAFRWQPPLTLTVCARFSHAAQELHGTGGFGFWNDPFLYTDQRWPTLPRAIWFFFSSAASNMKLARQTPGHGWKAATIDAWQTRFFLLLPTAPLAALLLRLPGLYRRLWPIAQRAMQVSEALIPVDLTNWHIYTLEWRQTGARFWVDQQLILNCATAPRGPLGLVIWLDNQAMVVTPWELPKHTLVASTTEQWLEVAWLSVAT